MQNIYLKKSMFLIGGSFVLFLSVRAADSVQKQAGQAACVSDSHVALVSPGDDVVAKKLQNPVMGLLDDLWGSKPSILLRVDLSKKAIKDVLTKIQARKAAGKTWSKKSDDDFIENEIKSILVPVAKFFDDIVAYAERIKPLLIESLVSPGHPAESVLLMKYFSLKEKDLYAFCSRTIISIDSFEQISHEFYQLFVDLKESLSPATKAAYSAYCVKVREEQIKMQKEKAAQQKVTAR